MLQHCRIRPAVVQAEAHPYFRNDQLVRWCRREGIHFTAYSPLGSSDSAALLQVRGQGAVRFSD